MEMKRAISKIFTFFLQIIIILLLLWGEFGGVWHSFKHYGVSDGFISIFIPPYAWFRSIEFFFWSVHQKKQATGEQWPELTTKEFSVISEISGKVLNESLNERDINRFRDVFDAYTKRVGRSLKQEEVDLLVTLMDVGTKYNKEFYKCIILSIDAKQPIFSSEYEYIYAVVDSYGIRSKDELDVHKRIIIAAGENEYWTDIDGSVCLPPTREQTLLLLENCDKISENWDKLIGILKEYLDD